MFLYHLFSMKNPLWVLIFVACAAQNSMNNQENALPAPSTNTEKKVVFEEKESSKAEIAPPTASIQRNFSFKLPDTLYEFTGNPNNEYSPIEFFRKNGGIRGEIKSKEASSTTLAEFARTEMHSRRKASSKNLYGEIQPWNHSGVEGLLWESSDALDKDTSVAVGFVVLYQEKFYAATIFADSAYSRKDFLETWKNTFAQLHFETTQTSDSSPELSPEAIQEYYSKNLGYSFKTKDTIWHFWNGISAQNADPDLVLTNLKEEVSLFVYGAIVPEDEVSENDLYKVLLRRLGISDSPEEITTQRKKKNSRSVSHFEATRQIGDYDFKYRGKFIYESGRGILVAGWSQGILAKEYKQLIENAINAIEMEELPEIEQDAKTAKFNAAVISETGLLRLEENQPLAALAYFEKANRMDSDEPLHLINCGFIYQLKELYGPGINHFQSQIELVKKNPKLLAILGEMYEAIYDYGNARRYVELGLHYTPNDPEMTINLSDALWGLGQRNQSLEVVLNLYENQPSSRLGVYAARTYMGLDQYAEAVELLYECLATFGNSKELGSSLMEALLFLGRYGEALSISEETLKLAPNNPKILTYRGKALFYLKNYKEAEKVLSKAYALQKDNDEVKNFLSSTRAFLGKADNKALKTPIEPVEKRRKIADMLSKEALQEAKDEGFPAIVHFRRESLKAPKKENWIHTEEMLIEIIDSRGSAMFQEFTYPFLPGYDRLYLNALEIYDSTHKLKQSVPLNNSYITYSTESGEHNESQTAHFPLPPLTPGDLIYLQVSRTGLNEIGLVPYMEYRSGMEIPVAKTSFRVYADTNRFSLEEYGPLERKDLADGREWQMEKPITIRNEIYMPDYRDFGAGLLLSGKRDWAEVGADYENLIRHQYKNAVAVREKAFEVKGNLLGKEAMFAIIHFVRDNIRYRDTQFGGHSIIPQLSEKTLKDYRGDCKDQALLLKEMLETIGIKSHLAAIPLSGNGYANLPTIQQFDHMILYIPAQDGIPEMWVDPTDKTGNDRPVPLDMEGKTAFIIDGKNSHIQTTPILEDSQEHRASFAHKLHINKNGYAEFRDSLQLEGKFASTLRNIFYGKDQKQQERLLENLLREGIPDVQLSQMRIDNLMEFDKPLRLVATFASKNYFGESSEGIKGHYPNTWERSMLKLPKINRRHLPIRIPHETQFFTSLEVSADNGKTIEIRDVAPLGRPFDYVSINKENGKIKWTTYALYAEPNEYEKIREEWMHLLKETSPLILIK